MTVQEWLGEENTLGIDIWEKKYRNNNENLDQHIDRLANKNPVLHRLLEDKKFMFGGRTTANRGTAKKASMMNCYSRGFVEDSLDDILQVNTDIGLTFKTQGGQGLSLSKLRPKGCGINGGQFQSDGIIPFMELYNRTTESISQGGSRKGALLMGLDIWHKEAPDFITIKSEEGRIQKANLSLEIDDEFMECIKRYYETGEVITKHIVRDYDGSKIEYDVTPIELYRLMMEKAYEWGEPGCIFTNRFRNYNLMEFCPDYNIEICNPSLRKGTKVLTDRGIVSIEELAHTKFKVQTLSGNYANAECFLSGKNKPLYEITLENGEKYFATKEHKWAILNNGRYTKTFTEDLQSGDWIPYTKNKSLGFGEKGTYEDGFFIGYWYGDGHLTVRKDDNRYQYGFTFGKEKAEVGILDFVVKKLSQITNKTINYCTRNRGIEDWYEICCGDSTLKKYMFEFGVYEDKHIFPKEIYSTLSEEFRKGFVDGVFSADGSVATANKGEGICLTTCSYMFAKSMGDLLWWYGIRNHINKCTTKLDGKEFDRYDLRISKRATKIFSEIFHLTHSTKQEKINNMADNIRKMTSDGHIKVKSVKLTDLHEDVYDIHVYDDSHTFRINHCVTGNCGEQPLGKNSACDLGSINLSEFVIDPFEETARFDFDDFAVAIDEGIRALDEIIDENKDNHALEAQKEMSLDYRNVGLGVMGMWDMLCKLNIIYGSQDSKCFIDSLMGFMFRRAVIASSRIAKEKGAFPKYSSKLLESKIFKKHFSDDDIKLLEIDKYGLRNCSLLSIAPTGSIGTMLNISTGCEPAFQISYKRKTESLNNGQEVYYDVYTGLAREYMKKYNTENLPETFKTAADIHWKDRIDIQAILQEHVDTAISSTVNLPNNIKLDEIEKLYLYAWEKGLKGVTIYRDGCKRGGILTTDKNTQEDNTSNQLERGMIIKADDNCIGKKRTIITGCGTLHCEAFFDPDTGELLETYFSKGSTGGCHNFMIGLSRMISLAARGGIDVYSIVDQLQSSGTCPSYAVRKATKHDTSKGSSCPVAIGNALISMYEEMKNDIGDDDESLKTENKPVKIKENKSNKPKCPECGEELFFEGGCNICKSCGWSKCD